MIALFIASGKFEDIIAVAAILVAVMYCVNYVAVFVLRVREPQMPRPFRAWGYPFTTGLVLAASLVFLVADIHDDPHGAIRAAALLGHRSSHLRLDALAKPQHRHTLHRIPSNLCRTVRPSSREIPKLVQERNRPNTGN